MRPPRALLVVLIAGLLSASAVALAPPSSAGGPTSVLLVDTVNGRATALYASDPRYERLSDLVGGATPPVADGSAPALSDGRWTPGSGGITATWLMHDVVVWRVDHIFAGPDATVSIASVSDMAGISSFDANPTWHRARDPKALTTLLTGLGLGSAAPASQVTASAPATPPATAAPRATAAAPASSTPPAPLWGLAGLLVGAGLMLAVVRLRRPRRSRHVDDDVDVPESAEVLHG